MPCAQLLVAYRRSGPVVTAVSCIGSQFYKFVLLYFDKNLKMSFPVNCPRVFERSVRVSSSPPVHVEGGLSTESTRRKIASLPTGTKEKVAWSVSSVPVKEYKPRRSSADSQNGICTAVPVPVPAANGPTNPKGVDVSVDAGSFELGSGGGPGNGRWKVDCMCPYREQTWDEIERDRDTKRVEEVNGEIDEWDEVLQERLIKVDDVFVDLGRLQSRLEDLLQSIQNTRDEMETGCLAAPPAQPPSARKIEQNYKLKRHGLMMEGISECPEEEEEYMSEDRKPSSVLAAQSIADPLADLDDDAGGEADEAHTAPIEVRTGGTANDPLADCTDRIDPENPMRDQKGECSDAHCTTPALNPKGGSLRNTASCPESKVIPIEVLDLDLVRTHSEGHLNLDSERSILKPLTVLDMHVDEFSRKGEVATLQEFLESTAGDVGGDEHQTMTPSSAFEYTVKELDIEECSSCSSGDIELYPVECCTAGGGSLPNSEGASCGDWSATVHESGSGSGCDVMYFDYRVVTQTPEEPVLENCASGDVGEECSISLEVIGDKMDETVRMDSPEEGMSSSVQEDCEVDEGREHCTDGSGCALEDGNGDGNGEGPIELPWMDLEGVLPVNAVSEEPVPKAGTRSISEPACVFHNDGKDLSWGQVCEILPVGLLTEEYAESGEGNKDGSVESRRAPNVNDEITEDEEVSVGPLVLCLPGRFDSSSLHEGVNTWDSARQYDFEDVQGGTEGCSSDLALLRLRYQLDAFMLRLSNASGKSSSGLETQDSAREFDVEVGPAALTKELCGQIGRENNLEGRGFAASFPRAELDVGNDLKFGGSVVGNVSFHEPVSVPLDQNADDLDAVCEFMNKGGGRGVCEWRGACHSEEVVDLGCADGLLPEPSNCSQGRLSVDAAVMRLRNIQEFELVEMNKTGRGVLRQSACNAPLRMRCKPLSASDLENGSWLCQISGACRSLLNDYAAALSRLLGWK